MKTIIKFFALALVISFISCKKDAKDPDPEPTPVTPAPATGTLKIRFEHLVDTLPLNFVQSYVNANLDTFNVTILKYYISNVVITKNDNSTFVEPNSYYLVDVSNPASTILNIANVPIGSYKSLSFMLGVDSARNNSGAQTGALAPSDMFWAWNSGYIMFKLEGNSPQSGSIAKSITYHIGGFGGVNKTQRNFNFNFASTTSNITGSNSPIINLAVNINEFFVNPTTINVATQFNTTMPGTMSKMFADNYADMISFEKVSN